MATLVKELPELVENHVISPQTAADIEKYYAARTSPRATSCLLSLVCWVVSW
jgi:hypothetical protein